jgi:hypothetical protein
MSPAQATFVEGIGQVVAIYLGHAVAHLGLNRMQTRQTKWVFYGFLETGREIQFLAAYGSDDGDITFDSNPSATFAFSAVNLLATVLRGD